MSPTPRPLLSLVCLFLSSSAWAQSSASESAKPARADLPVRPAQRFDATQGVIGRLNPLGLVYLGKFSYQFRLYESDSPLTANNYIGVGVTPAVSPAFVRGGLVLEIQPLSILRLWASYEGVGYFGSFRVFQSFPGVTSDHSDTTLLNLDDVEATSAYSTGGTILTVGGLLQAKVGPVAARNMTRLMRPDFDLREGDRTYYDILFDVLAPDEGWFLSNDFDLLWVTDLGLTVGGRYTLTQSFYEDRHYAPGETLGENPNTPTQRIGPLIAYTFWDEKGQSAFDRPTVVLIVNWWLQHRFRTGADVDNAIPYVALAFTVTGDLLKL